MLREQIPPSLRTHLLPLEGLVGSQQSRVNEGAHHQHLSLELLLGLNPGHELQESHPNTHAWLVLVGLDRPQRPADAHEALLVAVIIGLGGVSTS